MALLRFLTENRNVRKIFGKRELTIIERQLKGMNLTQSERNRLSRDIKPKFECILQLSRFGDEFELVKNQENKMIIQKAVTTILRDELEKHIRAILLFGSFADNRFTPRSDIDICVVFNHLVSLTEATKFRIRISGQLPDKVDIQVFNFLPLNVKRSIAENHKVLYQSNEFDNLNFSVRYIKDHDYLLRRKRIYEEN